MIVGPAGVLGVNVLAVDYILETFYDEVDDKRYFIQRLRQFISVMLKKVEETSSGDSVS